MISLFTELKRRNVFRVGIAYLITAWLIAQVLELVFDSFGAPGWAMKAVLVVLAVGLLLVLIFAWVFELTPEGIKRDSEVDHTESVTRQTGRKLDRAIIVVLVLALAYFVWESRFASEEKAGSEQFSQAAPQQAGNAVDEKRALTPAGPVSTGQSVAVLPFMNMSSDPEQEYFSDGITEEIINALVKIPGLSVPARTSVFAYKGRLQDVRDIGRELNVAHVLEGSIRSQGKQVRITAQLINVESGYHLWSETFDRQLENIFAVQEEIAGAIAEILVGELGVGVATVPNQTRDMEAYDLYLQGRAALRNRDDSAIALLEEVTRQDPDFAPGWAALAIAHNSIDDDDHAAIEAAERALSMDPDNVDALNAVGASLRGLRRWGEAENYFRRALAIDPNSAELLEDWAEFLNFSGRSDEALEVTTRALAIEPGLGPLQQEHTVALLATGRRKEARQAAEHMLEKNGAMRWFWLMSVWLTPTEPGQPVDLPPRPELEQKEPWTPEEQEFLSLMTSDSLSHLDESWGLRMRGLIEISLEKSKDIGLYAWTTRSALILAGQVDFVIDVFFLNNQDSRNQGSIAEGLWTPVFAPVRQHPRFGEFLQQYGLVDYWDATGWPKWCQRDNSGVIACR